MTKRAVWFVCLAIVLLTLGSVLYRVSAPTRFDAAVWQAADEPGEFLDRRAMLPDVTRMMTDRQIRSKETAIRYLGRPQQGDAETDNIWLYDLGGGRSPSAPDTHNWLALTFDSTGKLVNHRVTQQLRVPQ